MNWLDLINKIEISLNNENTIDKKIDCKDLLKEAVQISGSGDIEITKILSDMLKISGKEKEWEFALIELANQVHFCKNSNNISVLLNSIDFFYEPKQFLSVMFSKKCLDDLLLDCLKCVEKIVKKDSKIKISSAICTAITINITEHLSISSNHSVPLLSLFQRTGDVFFFKAARKVFSICLKNNESWEITEDPKIQRSIVQYYSSDQSQTKVDIIILLQISTLSSLFKEQIYEFLRARYTVENFGPLADIAWICENLTDFFIHNDALEPLIQLYDKNINHQKMIYEKVCQNINRLDKCIDLISKFINNNYCDILQNTLKQIPFFTQQTASKFLKCILGFTINDENFQTATITTLQTLLNESISSAYIGEKFAASLCVDLLLRNNLESSNSNNNQLQICNMCLSIISKQPSQILKVFYRRLWNIIFSNINYNINSTSFQIVYDELTKIALTFIDENEIISNHNVNEMKEEIRYLFSVILLIGAKQEKLSTKQEYIFKALFKTIIDKKTTHPLLLMSGIDCFCEFGSKYIKDPKEHILKLFHLLISTTKPATSRTITTTSTSTSDFDCIAFSLEINSLIVILEEIVKEQQIGYSVKSTPIIVCTTKIFTNFNSLCNFDQIRHILQLSFLSFVMCSSRIYDILIEEGEDESERWEKARISLLNLINQCIKKLNLNEQNTPLSIFFSSLPNEVVEHLKSKSSIISNDLLSFCSEHIKKELIKSVSPNVLFSYLTLINTLINNTQTTKEATNRLDCFNILLNTLEIVKFTHIPLTKSILNTALSLLSKQDKMFWIITLIERVLQNNAMENRLPLSITKSDDPENVTTILKYPAAVLNILVKSLSFLFRRQLGLQPEGKNLSSSPFFCNIVVQTVKCCCDILLRELPTLKLQNKVHILLERVLHCIESNCTVHKAQKEANSIMKQVLEKILILLLNKQSIQQAELLLRIDSFVSTAKLQFYQILISTPKFKSILQLTLNLKNNSVLTGKRQNNKRRTKRSSLKKEGDIIDENNEDLDEDEEEKTKKKQKKKYKRFNDFDGFLVK